MKFQVELNDFWLDEDEDILPSLKQHIIGTVVASINKQLSKKIEETITQQAKKQIQKKLLRKTNKIIDDFIETGKMSGAYSGSADMTVEEYIKQEFNRKNGWGNPKDQIEKLAKHFGGELRDRYDLLFATQIVKKLDHEGLLKEDVANLLLNESKKT